MALSHLHDLEKKLAAHGWRILAVREGDGFRISQYWDAANWKYPGRTITLEFEDMDDLHVLPVEKAYACAISGSGASLYFYSARATWGQRLHAFVVAMETYADALRRDG